MSFAVLVLGLSMAPTSAQQAPSRLLKSVIEKVAHVDGAKINHKIAGSGPAVVLTGEKASGTFLIDQAKLVANNVSGTVVKGSGQWLREAPDQVVPAIVASSTERAGARGWRAYHKAQDS